MKYEFKTKFKMENKEECFLSNRKVLVQNSYIVNHKSYKRPSEKIRNYDGDWYNAWQCTQYNYNYDKHD
jgi:hypothetical protein